MQINCFNGTVRGNRSLLKRAEVVNTDSPSFVCIIKKWANINAVYKTIIGNVFVVSLTLFCVFFYQT